METTGSPIANALYDGDKTTEVNCASFNKHGEKSCGDRPIPIKLSRALQGEDVTVTVYSSCRADTCGGSVWTSSDGFHWNRAVSSIQWGTSKDGTSFTLSSSKARFIAPCGSNFWKPKEFQLASTFFSDTPSTCSGTNLSCPDDANVDPCSTAVSCQYVYHQCLFGGSRASRKCVATASGTCVTSDSACYLKCQGNFVDLYFSPKRQTTLKAQACSDLHVDDCRQSYVAQKNTMGTSHGQYLGAWLATTCKLFQHANGTLVCMARDTCAFNDV